MTISPSPSTRWSCWRGCAPSCGGICSWAAQASTLVIGGICLDDNAKTVTVDGDPVALTPKEYDILRFLMRNAGTVFSPNEIYRRVWEDVPLNAAGAIAVHIRHLREKLEINPSEPRYIKVVWGKGYKMEGGVS